MWRGWWGSWCEGGDGGCGGLRCRPSAPGIPRSFRCAALAPPYAEAKGAWIPACAGMTGVWRGDGVWRDGGGMWWSAVPLVRPGHTPLTAFAPLSSGTKGAWIPACAGMTRIWRRNEGVGAGMTRVGRDGGGCGGLRCRPSAPGIPRSFRCAALAPPYAARRGRTASPRSAPGIPRSLRSRPFRRGRKGRTRRCRACGLGAGDAGVG